MLNVNSRRQVTRVLFERDTGSNGQGTSKGMIMFLASTENEMV